jgi:paraquat-inducible protein B
MSRQANKAVIGIFVVGAIVLAVVAVVVLGSGKFFKQTFTAVCYFEGSVGGLNIGAPVVFRGVRIGSVKSVILSADAKTLAFVIPVYIEMEPDKFAVVGARPKLGENLKTFIARGLRASLETQSIVTGQMQVGLDFHPDKPAKFVEFRIDTKTPEIPTVPTPMQELAKKIQNLPIDQIFEKMASVLDGINGVVKSPEIPEAIRSLNLALVDVRRLVKDLDVQIGPLGSNVNETVLDVRKLLQNADAKVTGLASNLDGAVTDVRGLVKNADEKVTGLTANLDGTLTEVRHLVQNADAKVTGLSSNLDGTLTEVRGLVKNADAKVTGLTSNLDGAVTDVRRLVKNVDNNIEPVAAGIQRTLKSIDAALIAAQQGIDKFADAVGDESPIAYELLITFGELQGLARSFRILADDLQRRPESLIRGK